MGFYVHKKSHKLKNHITLSMLFMVMHKGGELFNCGFMVKQKCMIRYNLNNSIPLNGSQLHDSISTAIIRKCLSKTHWNWCHQKSKNNRIQTKNKIIIHLFLYYSLPLKRLALSIRFTLALAIKMKLTQLIVEYMRSTRVKCPLKWHYFLMVSIEIADFNSIEWSVLCSNSNKHKQITFKLYGNLTQKKKRAKNQKMSFR